MARALDTISYGYSDSGWKDLLTSYDGQTLTSDAIGNLTNDGTWSYMWQHGRQLSQMTRANGAALEYLNYTYDADGHRIGKERETIVTVGGEAISNSSTTKYIYLGDTLTEMQIINVDESVDTFRFTYDATGPMSMTFYGTEYFYLKNAQGDVTGIVNAAGTQVVAYTYDAWGKLLSTTGSMASTLGEYNPLRYRGYVYDTETGLYYLNSRYYNPETGRFINADGYVSTGQGIVGNNMFAYCGNNPVKHLDSTGELFFGALCGGILGAIAGGISAAKNGENIFVGALVGSLVGVAIGTIGGFAAAAVKAGTSIIMATAVSSVAGAVVYAGGDALNQYTNYRLQDKTKREGTSKRGSTSTGQSQAVADRAYNAKSFAEYVEPERIAQAAISGFVFTGIGSAVGSVLPKVGSPSPVTFHKYFREAVWTTDLSCFQYLFDSTKIIDFN